MKQRMFKYFTIGEFDCQHTGENEMDHEFIEKLSMLRRNCNFPFVITSGYRSLDHPLEVIKEKGGTHTQGIAADIRVRGGVQRAKVVAEAIKLGFGGVGVANSFVHVDGRSGVPVLWCY